MTIDLATGEQRVLSDPGDGRAAAWSEPAALAIDSGNDRILVADSAAGAVIAVDPSTGDRAVLSGLGAGTGPALLGPRGIAIDSARDRAIVADRDASALIAIALDSGTRSVLSGVTAGNGPDLSEPGPLAVDLDNQRAVVAQGKREPLMAVDLVTGDRSVLASLDHLERTFPHGIALDVAGDQAVLTMSESRQIPWDYGQLITVNLTTGATTVLSGRLENGLSDCGDGPIAYFPVGVAFDSVTRRALVTEAEHDNLYTIDLAIGDRSLPWAIDDCASRTINRPDGIAVDRAAGHLVVMDLAFNGLIAVDFATGAERPLTLAAPRPAALYNGRLALDPSNNQALVIEAINGPDTSRGHISRFDLITAEESCSIRASSAGPYRL